MGAGHRRRSAPPDGLAPAAARGGEADGQRERERIPGARGRTARTGPGRDERPVPAVPATGRLQREPARPDPGRPRLYPAVPGGRAANRRPAHLLGRVPALADAGADRPWPARRRGTSRSCREGWHGQGEQGYDTRTTHAATGRLGGLARAPAPGSGSRDLAPRRRVPEPRELVVLCA